MPFSLVKEKIFSGAFESARSAGNTSVVTLYVAASRRASSSRRSFRRAVRTSFVPPAANSSASATPIPALAPVMRAHFPNQFAAAGGIARDKRPSAEEDHRTRGKKFLAERVGFEPTVGVNLHTLSKRAP